jgi:hypothetical protein
MSDLDDDNTSELLGKIYRDLILIVLSAFLITSIHLQYRDFITDVTQARAAYNYLGLGYPLDDAGLLRGFTSEPSEVLERLLTITGEPPKKFKDPMVEELRVLSEKGSFFGATLSNFFSLKECFVLFLSTTIPEEVAYPPEGGMIMHESGILYSLILDEECAYSEPDVVLPSSVLIMENGNIPYLYFHERWLGRITSPNDNVCLFHNSCREISSALSADSLLNKKTLLKVDVHNTGQEFRRATPMIELIAKVYAGQPVTFDTVKESSILAADNLRSKMPSANVSYLKQTLGRQYAPLIAVVLNFFLQVALFHKILAMADKSYSVANSISMLRPSLWWNVPHHLCRWVLLLSPFIATVWLGLLYQDTFRFVFPFFNSVYINVLEGHYLFGDDILPSYRSRLAVDVSSILIHIVGIVYLLSLYSAFALTPKLIDLTTPKKHFVRKYARAKSMVLAFLKSVTRFNKRRKVSKKVFEAPTKRDDKS